MNKIEQKHATAEHVEKSSLSNEELSSHSAPSPQTRVVKSPAERRFVKKLNWTVLPFVWFIVFIQFADKSALSVSNVLGMLVDTNTTPKQYGLLGSLFYVGYILFQIPNSYLIQRVPISKYLGTLLILWGISVGCNALCQNFAQLLACRLLLGLFEAGTYPCLYIIINSMYRRQEQSATYGFLWMSNGSGTIFSVLISYGIANISNTHGIALWRWGSIIFGILTVIIGILTFFFFADTPHSKWLRLTEEEKEIVEMRIQDNSVVRKREVLVSQYWECFKEPRYYLVALAAFANNLSNGGLVVFSTPFVHTLGFTPMQAILLQMPSATITVIFCFLSVMLHRKTNSYVIVSAVCSGIAMIGCILLASLPHTSIKLLGYYLAWGYNGSYIMLLSLVGSNVSGYSKKIWYNGTIMIAYCIGNLIGPLVMVDQEAPVYRSGMITFVAGNFVVFLCIAFISFLSARVNKKRMAHGPVGTTDAHLNLTDRQDENFIYKL
ncbi:MFS general substrate transporter [Hesseltinella vesiculosa]|uniref:MFS general substrate transporter n=1 Tax=Hesseltinella vesiculosa TaxID=101127 RepID=A0A1X2G4G8_9FUNG|nr:MFS general substrate transporter [Hesseltinella vesiculosa]